MPPSLEVLGTFPSSTASTESFSKQCEADTGEAAGAVHSRASRPWPITGNDVMRRRAAPIGMRVTDSSDSIDLTGLGWSLPTRPSLSICQAGILRALANSAIGQVSGVNGSLGKG